VGHTVAVEVAKLAAPVAEGELAAWAIGGGHALPGGHAPHDLGVSGCRWGCGGHRVLLQSGSCPGGRYKLK